MLHDLVIRDGLIVDGTGAAPIHGDIAIDGVRIAAVGKVDGRGAVELSADGLAITPGFIDAHTHMDAQVMWDELGSCSCWHGVTTVVMGNCGFSLAPVRANAHALVVRNLERAEDIAAEAMEAGISWGWETFAEYLDAVERRPKAINYAAYVGHSALRTWAMGERAFSETATDEDLAAMCGQLGEALDAGAIGLSTSRSANHETADDRPVASRMADWNEVRRLVGVMTERGRGMFELALEPAARSRDGTEQSEFLDRLKALAVDTGVPITYGVLGGRDERLLPYLAEVNRCGGRMIGQSHGRGVAALLSFATSLPFDALVGWQALRALLLPEQLAAMRRPEVRAALVDSAMNDEYPRAIGAEGRKPDYDRLYVMSTPLPPHRSVASLAGEQRRDPVEVMIDLALATDGQQFFIQPLSSEDPSCILPFLRSSDTVMTFSDSGAHVSQIIDSSIQTHFLAYWVREQEAFSLAEGVRMITAAVADAWGMPDRGRLTVGSRADVNLLDPMAVRPTMPMLVHDLPAGARRLVQRSEGIAATIVGGRITVLAGETTDARPGQLVREAGRHTAFAGR